MRRVSKFQSLTAPSTSTAAITTTPFSKLEEHLAWGTINFPKMKIRAYNI
jgi:hypothetical protein